MNNLLSYSSLKLDLFSKDGLHLKSASGFVVETGEQYYIITNWHVLSGKDFPAHPAQEPAATPYLLKTSIRSHGGQGEQRAPLWSGAWQRITVPLCDDSGRNEQRAPEITRRVF